MTLEDISLLSQIVGGFAVMASLVFVGLQIRDNSRAVRAATAQAVHDNYAGWYTALLGNESALATSAKGFVDLGALTPAEKCRSLTRPSKKKNNSISDPNVERRGTSFSAASAYAFIQSRTTVSRTVSGMPP